MQSETEKLVAQATLLVDRNQIPQAFALYQQVLGIDPGNVEALLMLGSILGEAGQLPQALAMLNRALQTDPAHVETHAVLANIYMRSGEQVKAVHHAQRAVELDADFPEMWLLLSGLHGMRGSADEAQFCARKVLELDPECVDGYVNLANAQKALGDFPAAAVNYREALHRNPGRAEIHYNLGLMLVETESAASALACFRQALVLAPDYAGAHSAIGNIRSSQGEFDAALDSYRHALELMPDLQDAIAGVANVYEIQGRPKDAYAAIEPYLDAEPLSASMVLAFARVSDHVGENGRAMQLLARSVVDAAPSQSERASLYFALGKQQERAGQYDDAFSSYRQGNRLVGADFDREAFSARIDRMISFFTRETLGRLPHATVGSDRPVFIVGMPRSGTSLAEQIIASHPMVFGAGELPDLGRIVAGVPALLHTTDEYPGCLDQLTARTADEMANSYLARLDALDAEALRVSDKMPDNFQDLGVIGLLFSGARVIHVSRNPFDTCISCYFTRFQNQLAYTFDLDDLGFYYREYQRLMAHWKTELEPPLFDLEYEQLLADPENSIRALIEFCGLEWSDECLRFYDNPRIVNTASYDQVRSPLYNSSVGRWKNYTKYLEPLTRVLGPASA